MENPPRVPVCHAGSHRECAAGSMPPSALPPNLGNLNRKARWRTASETTAAVRWGRDRGNKISTEIENHEPFRSAVPLDRAIGPRPPCGRPPHDLPHGASRSSPAHVAQLVERRIRNA